MPGLKDNIEEYIDLQKERLILNVADKSSDIVSAVGVRIAYMTCALFAIVFLSISLAIGINYMANSQFLGFLIVAVLYAVISVLLFKNGEKWFGQYIASEMLDIFYKDEDNEKF
ncbi:phage holin family protein [Arcticibacterium luteifluviistationis]|uniref:Competence protein n=1 Tax=Arcticibacterium luteifluviistationis TaxID=1784714 RepID=A0A2Z4GHJ3_9BACT|nr:phage holin family protein [Arcticibacterium luteifluviistationis]AWW00399.1 hypothetical protein DJ013_20355 [Arcticibacterium luteifluviistationis]